MQPTGETPNMKVKRSKIFVKQPKAEKAFPIDIRQFHQKLADRLRVAESVAHKFLSCVS
jgi:hypothetical protein